jgi:hypothetical protein
MEKPPPDPRKILAYWDEWERGDTTPGRVMANIKTAGLPELLAQLAGAPAPAPAGPREPVS